MKIIIRIELEDEERSKENHLQHAREHFPEATSICLESEDGTSETIYTGKENA